MSKQKKGKVTKRKPGRPRAKEQNGKTRKTKLKSSQQKTTSKKTKRQQSFLDQFGKRLRSLRKASKLSQAELAERAKCNISFIGSIERGQKTPTLPTIAKIADGLDLHITKLFDLAEHRSEETQLMERLEDRFYAILNESDRASRVLFCDILDGFLKNCRR